MSATVVVTLKARHTGSDGRECLAIQVDVGRLLDIDFAVARQTDILINVRP